jgi:hypothetical protein
VTSPARRPAVRLAAGLALIGFGWACSLAGLEPVRRYWFELVWSGYILAADGAVLARTGASLLGGNRRRVAAMFALSAAFWWLYELVNQHLRNWFYVGDDPFPAPLRALLETVAFATVLPALAESRDLLRSFVRLPDPPAVALPRPAGAWAVGAGLAGALLLWRFPDQAFPLVWVAPFLVLDGVAALRSRPSALGLVRAGRAGPVLLVALAGLATGVLWELWNAGALPHWSYRVPYVGAAKVFEMPLLGYLGYLPFALAADAVWRTASGGWGGLVEAPVTDLGRPGRPGRWKTGSYKGEPPRSKESA